MGFHSLSAEMLDLAAESPELRHANTMMVDSAPSVPDSVPETSGKGKVPARPVLNAGRAPAKPVFVDNDPAVSNRAPYFSFSSLMPQLFV